ncbi:MAG: hypothetical protein V1685_05455 [Parcubacteria group bacterium]
MKIFYPILIVLAATVALLGCSSKESAAKQQPTPQTAKYLPPAQQSGAPVSVLRPIVPDNPEDFKLTPDEQRVFDFCDSSLTSVARKSHTADSLLRFYRAHGVPARYMGSGQIKVLSTTEDSLFFFVYVNQSGDSTIGAHEAKVVATFSIPARSLGIEMCGFSKFVQGMMLAHELSHAVDCLVNHEPNSEALSDDWLMGEINAHHTTYAILNEYSKDTWGKLVRDSREERLKTALAGGHSNQSFTIGNMPGDSSRIVSCMKTIKLPWSVQDFNVLATWMTVDANMVNISIVAGSSDQDRMNGMGMFMRAFYSAMMERVPPPQL